MNITFPVWNIEAETGYKPITTFWQDFSIADRFGIAAIKDTYKRGFKTAKALGVEYLTEFVMVLNWKIFQFYKSNQAFAIIYDELWSKADTYCCENLKGEELSYYYKTTD